LTDQIRRGCPIIHQWVVRAFFAWCVKQGWPAMRETKSEIAARI
jgi:hypothetical protein